ncbi:MAG: HK97 family phage prohead protease [Rickettsiales bacterium]
MYIDKKDNALRRKRSRLAFNLQIKSLDNDGRFAGYASVFDVVDNQRDIILRGAFVNSLKGRVGEIKMLWQHRQDDPVGVFEKIFEDSRGLYVEGRLLLNLEKAIEAYSLMKEGVISGLSIGYTPITYRVNEKTGVRTISVAELWEISLVTFPANDAARITVLKQDIPAYELVELAEALDRAIGIIRE